MARKATLRETITTAADGAGGADDPTSLVQEFLECMEQYTREFQKWEKRVEKILKRYRDEQRENRTGGEAKFNILWSNVQTLVPATFSKLPTPDVSRRFKDQDPTGRVAAMLLERGLEFEIQHYKDYRATMDQCVHDRFLGGRGTAWVRYEPHFKGVEGGEDTKSEKDDGSQITEDTDAAPVNEAIDYECAPIDYVHWRDFGHDVARTWEEVTRVWRNVYMSEDAVKTRFGETVAKTLPYDASPETTGRKDKLAQETAKKQALVIELWDKTRGKAYWFSKSQKKILDEKDDPLGLQEFFPCPRPLYSTLTNDTLVPVPDFTLYQDQACTLDVLADRMDGLAKMLQVKGIYDASVPELARLFTEGENGTLIPGKNWAAFAEKNGLKGSLQMVELKDIYEALRACAETMDSEKSQVYEITGISDIIRGQTEASETATAQQIKGQYASLRLRAMQDEVARFATEILQLKAQVICGKFSPSTISAISAADQLSDVDKQQVFVAAQVPLPMPGVPPVAPTPPEPVGPAMALLIGQERITDPKADSPNPMRSFRIEVAADTLVQLDEQREKQDRLEFVETVGAYLEKAIPLVAQIPAAGPITVELLKFGVRGFKVGKQIEGLLDAAVDQLKQMAQAGPPPDPKAMEEQIRQQVTNELTQKNATKEIAVTKREADLDIREMKFQAEQAIDKQNRDFQKQAQEQEVKRATAELDGKKKQEEHESKIRQERASFDEERAMHAQKQAETVDADTKGRDAALVELVQTIAESNAETTAALKEVAQALTRPKKVMRGKDGKVEGVA